MSIIEYIEPPHVSQAKWKITLEYECICRGENHSSTVEIVRNDCWQATCETRPTDQLIAMEFGRILNALRAMGDLVNPSKDQEIVDAFGDEFEL